MEPKFFYSCANGHHGATDKDLRELNDDKIVACVAPCPTCGERAVVRRVIDNRVRLPGDHLATK